jgi:hypothetical protein
VFFRLCFAGLLCGLILLGGCAGGATRGSVSPEDELRDRVTAYWGYKIRGEFDKSYEFEDPLYRKNVSMVTYIRSFPAGASTWVGARVEALKVEGDTASVDMKVKLRVRAGLPEDILPEVALKEKWLKSNGAWYHVH